MNGKNAPPVHDGQGDVVRYRIAFTKLGTIAVTSHLDLARVLPRIIRRAGLTMIQLGLHAARAGVVRPGAVARREEHRRGGRRLPGGGHVRR
ncbi:MAG: DUF2344 domain-containing protein [Myxococcota bacterium]